MKIPRFTRIPLINGDVAIVDTLDYVMKLKHREWRALRPTGRNLTYAATRGQPVLMHRMILDAPRDVEVDHRDGDGLNNRRSNLRFATRNQNQANRRKGVGYSSVFKGVSKKRGKWVAAIRIDQRSIHLGTFTDEEDAARAYDKAALEAWGEYSRVNFPDELARRSYRRRVLLAVNMAPPMPQESVRTIRRVFSATRVELAPQRRPSVRLLRTNG